MVGQFQTPVRRASGERLAWHAIRERGQLGSQSSFGDDDAGRARRSAVSPGAELRIRPALMRRSGKTWRLEWDRKGADVSTVQELDRLLDELTMEGSDAPFMVDLLSPSGDSLSVGLGRGKSVLSWVQANRDPPLLREHRDDRCGWHHLVRLPRQPLGIPNVECHPNHRCSCGNR